MRIAFCFLVKDTIPHYRHWKRFIDLLPADIQIIVHAYSGTYKGGLAATTVKTVRTSWEHTIAAHKQLIHEALRLDCDRLLLFSESCLPIANPRRLLDYLDIDVSYFNYNPPFFLRPGVASRYRHSRAPFGGRRDKWILPFMWFAEQWYVLNRPFMELLHRDKKVYNLIRRCWGDNEVWPLTAIYYEQNYRAAHKQKLADYEVWFRWNQFEGKTMWQHIPGVKRCKLTYVNWTPGAQHPDELKRIDRQTLEDVRSTGAVFMRKVPANAVIDIEALGY